MKSDNDGNRTVKSFELGIYCGLTNMSNAAVLDKEIGLVWEQSPSRDTFTWENAQRHCNGLATGGFMGLGTWSTNLNVWCVRRG